ncbi:hypothetical protein M407DRAFT_246676 [Tulasnella calospora MUT 4182]|uniref:Uncharacterized protein n=1 Tax=Tulasnella calospora MUT 4182 TaxID=1051891 RepID=A0A0C3PSH8_9AGAM|nr:hypothetical protein M407DRAFT_246676 [Tulasnella calospora MUT 4182]
MRPIVSLANAGIYTVISIFGAIILSVFGYGFAHNWEALMGSTNDPEDGKAVAKVCYLAAVSYVFLGAFCACQLGVHTRKPRGEIQL